MIWSDPVQCDLVGSDSGLCGGIRFRAIWSDPVQVFGLIWICKRGCTWKKVGSVEMVPFFEKLKSGPHLKIGRIQIL